MKNKDASPFVLKTENLVLPVIRERAAKVVTELKAGGGATFYAQDIVALIDDIETLKAYVAGLESAEPDLYQYRSRPTWYEDMHWFEWQDCTKESAEDYEAIPKSNDWEYEVRRLYVR